MQKPKCYRCMTYFQQGQQLPAQDLTYELKNYTFPIKDSQHKFILLKTIVSFLNSRGGTIFIGAQDKTGQVVGINIQRKQQDQYRLFLRGLIKNIQPQVDLSQRADVVLQFFPVFKNGVFVGRYIGKITVKQGITSKLYCITQKVELQLENNRKNYDEFEVVYSFQRSSMGNVDKITGYNVVAKAAAKAINPLPAINIFHEGCNPQPLIVASSQASQRSIPSDSNSKRINQNSQKQAEEQTEDYTIQFFRIKEAAARQKLEDTIQELISKLGIKWYIMSYEEENDTLLIEFKIQKQWTKFMDYIDANLDKINDQLQGHAVFSKKQAEQDYAIYQNQRPLDSTCVNAQVCQLKQQSSNSQQKKQQSRKLSTDQNQQKRAQIKQQQEVQQQVQEAPKGLKKSESIQQQIAQNNTKKFEKKTKISQKNSNEYQIKLTSQSKKKQSLYSSNNFITVPSSVNIQQSLVLSITHLNPSRKSQLKQYVQSLTKSNKKTDQFDKTLQFHFESQKDFDETYDKLSKSKDLTKYGFRGMLRFGINTGQITVDNYDKKKYKQFKTYINKLVGQDAKRCQFIKKGDKYSLLLTLKNPNMAAMWLDKLIQDKDIKNFRIQNNESLKMKIDLVCVKPTKIKRDV